MRYVPRTHVVPVESVMGPPSSGDHAGTVALGTKVRDVVRLVATSDLPVRVVDADGVAVGSVNRVAVLSVVAGEELVASPAAGS